MGDSIWKVTDILVLHIVWSDWSVLPWLCIYDYIFKNFCNELCMIANTILQILFQIIPWLFNQLLKYIDQP